MNLFHTPVQNGTEGAGHVTPINSIGNPVPPGTQKLSVISNGQINEVKVGHFGKLEFLDNQKEFEKTFGYKQNILPPNPVSQYSSNGATFLYAYSEKCKLDVFIHICRTFYVGCNSVDNYLSIKDVCHRI